MENDKHHEQVQLLQGEIQHLKQDNLNLYEKIRYLGIIISDLITFLWDAVYNHLQNIKQYNDNYDASYYTQTRDASLFSLKSKIYGLGQANYLPCLIDSTAW